MSLTHGDRGGLMNASKAMDRICRAFAPFECTCAGGKYGGDPIIFTVRDSSRLPIYSAKIWKSEWRSDERLSDRIENERDVLKRKGYELDPLKS